MSFDGISAAAASGGFLNGVTGDRTEAFQEVRVEAAGNNAEFNTVGQVSVITRGGTNQLHGSAYDAYDTPGLAARNPFSTINTAPLQHLPGGTLSGPIYLPKIYNGRNGTFFFMALETNGLGPTVNTWTPSVPLAAWRAGDFSGLLPGTVVKDPFGNTTLPNNVIPASRLNPVAAKLQNQFYPLPNYGNTNIFSAGNFRSSTHFTAPPSYNGNLRVDHKFSDKVWIYGHITKIYLDTSAAAGSIPTFGILGRWRWSDAYGLAFTYMITPTLVAEVRYGPTANCSVRRRARCSGVGQNLSRGLGGAARRCPLPALRAPA
jgi:hypothetical protein